jgi:heme a synthase
MQWSDAFDFTRDLGKLDSGANIGLPALTAMHYTHRLGAIVVFFYLTWLGLKATRTTGLNSLGVAVLLALAVQIMLGLSNVMWSLPLPVAVLHTGGAAVLLATLVVLNYRTAHARRSV